MPKKSSASSSIKKEEDLKSSDSRPKGKEQKLTIKPDNIKGKAATTLHQMPGRMENK